MAGPERIQPTQEHLRLAFQYLRSTARSGPPWPARMEDLPADSARRVAVQAVARSMARRLAVARAREAARFDAKLAAAGDQPE